MASQRKSKTKALKKFGRNIIAITSSMTTGPLNIDAGRVTKPDAPHHSPGQTVAFHHAGYDPSKFDTIMFRLTTSAKSMGGVCAAIVWMILAALVDVETLSSIRFSSERNRRPTCVASHQCFVGKEVWIHYWNSKDTLDLPCKFPITPSFDVWTVPRQTPSFWAQEGMSSMSERCSALKRVKSPTGLELSELCNKAVMMRDKLCVLSNAPANECERAYIVPNNKRQFRIQENMSRHFGIQAFPDTSHNILHPMNGLLLRADLHEAYMKGDSILVPVQKYWRVHFFDPESSLGKKFDQQPVSLSAEIPRTFLMVRIVMKAFELARGFLEQGEREGE